MKLRTLSKKDIKELEPLFVPLGVTLDRKATNQIRDDVYLVVNGKIQATLLKDTWIPRLQTEYTIPTVTVDMGAIKFVLKGADIMRPGIVSCEEFAKDTLVAIIDQTYSKHIAIGRALVDSQTLLSQESGKVVANLHFFGDDICKQE